MLSIRQIQPQDNDAIASVVRTVMSAFDADPQTTIVGDPTLNIMYQHYQTDRAVYYVAMWGKKVVGGCGLKHLEGTDENICELQRMFLLTEARGKGIGNQLIALCLQKAEDFGYQKVYIETLRQMREAQNLYRKYGFDYIPKALGDTGHCGCDVKMLKVLSTA